MHRAFEIKIHLPYQHCACCGTICRLSWRTGHQSVQRQSSDHVYELRDEHEAEANIVVAVVRRVVVAIRRATVLRIVVPAAATQNTVRTHDRCPFWCYKSAIIFFRNSLALACSVKAINGITCFLYSCCVHSLASKFSLYIFSFLIKRTRLRCVRWV